MSPSPSEPVEVREFGGDRAEIRWLFELAESSAAQLDGYIHLGVVFVARDAGAVVGHVQLIPHGAPGRSEIKNMAVDPPHQGRGVGTALVAHAVDVARAGGADRLLVSTASADTGNLRFYQRQGFRMLSVTRDAFGPESGYPEPLVVEGVEIRDQVWLDREL